MISSTQDICNLVLFEILLDEMPVERRGNVNEKNGKSNVPKKSYSPSGPDVRSKETTEHTSESKNF